MAATRTTRPSPKKTNKLPLIQKLLSTKRFRMVSFALVFVVIGGIMYLRFSKASTDHVVCSNGCIGIAGADANKYWVLGGDGGVFTFGNLPFYGAATGQPSGGAKGLAARPQKDGYWIVGADGGVFAYGNAGYFGSIPQLINDGVIGGLNAPIVGISATHTGNGYWLFARDGGVFSFGDAPYLGAPDRNTNWKALVASGDSMGYWCLTEDGQIFSYGDIQNFNVESPQALNKPIVGGASKDRFSLLTVAGDGGVFTHGNAGYFGSRAGQPLNYDVVSIATTSNGGGYWLLAGDGGVFSYGNAEYVGSPTPTPPPGSTNTAPAPSSTITQPTTTTTTAPAPSSKTVAPAPKPISAAPTPNFADGGQAAIDQAILESQNASNEKDRNAAKARLEAAKKYLLGAPAKSPSASIAGTDCAHIPLEVGDSNKECVRQLQIKLNVNADGAYGPTTATLVNVYRVTNGLANCSLQNVDNLTLSFLYGWKKFSAPGCNPAAPSVNAKSPTKPNDFYKDGSDSLTGLTSGQYDQNPLVCVHLAKKTDSQEFPAKVKFKILHEVTDSAGSSYVNISKEHNETKDIARYCMTYSSIYSTKNVEFQVDQKGWWVNVYKGQ